jgi:hypothetical protein
VENRHEEGSHILAHHGWADGSAPLFGVEGQF